MSETVSALRKKLEARIRAARKIIATKEATIRRAELDLADLENAESRLQKQREKRIKKASGSSKVPETKTAPKTILRKDKVEIPTVEMDLPAAAPGQEEKKEKTGFGFFRG